MLENPSKHSKDGRGSLLQFLGIGRDEKTNRTEKNGSVKEPEERKHQFAVWYIFAAFFGVMLIQYIWIQFTQIETIPYSQFEQLVDENKISDVLVGADGIQGTLKEPLPDGRKIFSTARVDPQLAGKLRAHGIKVPGAPPNSFLSSILSWVFAIFLFYLLWNYGIRHLAERQGFGGQNAIEKSRAKIYVETNTKVTFRDVAGVSEAKFELQEVVAFLRDPKSFGRVGARIPKGRLLVGPPGTGKTLLARAVAGEAGVPFFSISGSEFIQMFVGVGASRVPDMFKNARETAPCLLFIDEIDAVGRMRGAGVGGGSDEREQTLNQILSEMDGFQPTESVIVVAAPNRPDVLDSALLRPGRFDRHVTVDRPTWQGRLAILKVHTRTKPLADEVNLEAIARKMIGMTGADLRNLANEAALIAPRENKTKIDRTDFERAADRVLIGAKREEVLSEEEKRRTAYHEAGHAVVTWLEPESDKPLKVSIVPRGRTGGINL